MHGMLGSIPSKEAFRLENRDRHLIWRDLRLQSKHKEGFGKKHLKAFPCPTGEIAL